MMTGSPTANNAQGFIPLASLLRLVDPLKLYDVQQNARRFGREELLTQYRTAFKAGQRKRTYVTACALVANGVPPWVWHDGLELDDLHINTRYDLFLADVMWLRRHYPGHADVVRYKRGKLMLTGGDAVFHREAEYAFFRGRRPAWKLAGSLSLNTRQQLEACYLRTAPVKKRAEITAVASEHVYKALRDDLCTVRRTATFGETEALATLQRRHALWRCSRMATSASPTETAVFFEQLTGMPITRQAVAQQLEKIRSTLRKAEMTWAT
ncbi:hypothetical protein GCM10027277_26940 [Pseudoduganella ginsengisoli]|uniref:Uncharacterized protein n=1 Tax=Pseudoduganella ginsengisoli TaxID=1462440 RepID=A0A6L6Q236_9BURK|nr:hypothetical protein [Pseudoduganella ginsengisoli]MTW03499.1 hypothetical protein [Pseudoduganella ginsengisoli]